MRRTRFDDAPCPVARTTDLVGDWWTPLVLRECFYGVTRFDDFCRRLGIGRNVLTQRLGRLVDEGVLERQRYEERPPRDEYLLTEKGRELFGVLAAMLAWGNAWLSSDGDLVELVDRTTGRKVDPVLVDRTTGRRIDPDRLSMQPGPGVWAGRGRPT
ncbi:transcriptional regulator [Egibacter rhizosphaerae]|uniref:Transcriptional regulator n=1 Tax=Egibacter rhizosphaerae TaxID=1670831 RepID=A0A411YCY8_9ACTN|nr:helix-turn-helix domain-containing protein [Egibacter rhizosphaerae]QBI19069.1 transcriptional regulator [Egibacter rhizosphaerae]